MFDTEATVICSNLADVELFVKCQKSYSLLSSNVCACLADFVFSFRRYDMGVCLQIRFSSRAEAKPKVKGVRTQRKCLAKTTQSAPEVKMMTHFKRLL
jgi:hypothetical protein